MSADRLLRVYSSRGSILYFDEISGFFYTRVKGGFRCAHYSLVGSSHGDKCSVGLGKSHPHYPPTRKEVEDLLLRWSAILNVLVDPWAVNGATAVRLSWLQRKHDWSLSLEEVIGKYKNCLLKMVAKAKDRDASCRVIVEELGKAEFVKFEKFFQTSPSYWTPHRPRPDAGRFLFDSFF